MPRELRQGALIEYRLKLHGVPIRWLTQIEEWAPGERFVDVQLRGPYALWHHTHEFEPAGDGHTLMRDTVRYALPLGPLGALAHKLFVSPRPQADIRLPLRDRERALHPVGAVIADRAIERVLTGLEVDGDRGASAAVTVSVSSSTPLPSISTACGDVGRVRELDRDRTRGRRQLGLGELVRAARVGLDLQCRRPAAGGFRSALGLGVLSAAGVSSLVAVGSSSPPQPAKTRAATAAITAIRLIPGDTRPRTPGSGAATPALPRGRRKSRSCRRRDARAARSGSGRSGPSSSRS